MLSVLQKTVVAVNGRLHGTAARSARYVLHTMEKRRTELSSQAEPCHYMSILICAPLYGLLFMMCAGAMKQAVLSREAREGDRGRSRRMSASLQIPKHARHTFTRIQSAIMNRSRVQRRA